MTPRTIHVLLLSLFLSLSVATSCDTDGGGGECAGMSRYVIDNQSAEDLTVDVVFKYEGENESGERLVVVGTAVEIGSKSMFGYFPKPSDAITSITVYTGAADALTEVMAIDPVDDAAWTEESIEGDDTCGVKELTLTIVEW